MPKVLIRKVTGICVAFGHSGRFDSFALRLCFDESFAVLAVATHVVAIAVEMRLQTLAGFLMLDQSGTFPRLKSLSLISQIDIGAIVIEVVSARSNFIFVWPIIPWCCLLRHGTNCGILWTSGVVPLVVDVLSILDILHT